MPKKEKEEKIEEDIEQEESKQISKIKLSRIEKEIKKQTTISKKRKNKINKKIFKNILIAICVVIYFIIIILCYDKLKQEIYYSIIHILSIITILASITIFEIAYNKEDEELALHGIEMLVLSIITLLNISISIKHKENYIYIINAISMLFVIYYVAKSIIIFRKMMKKALKRTSDIHKIGRIEE